jgi:hypothetical protein
MGVWDKGGSGAYRRRVFQIGSDAGVVARTDRTARTSWTNPWHRYWTRPSTTHAFANLLTPKPAC